MLLSGAAKPLGADAEAILFAAARDDHVRSTIEPALARGRWVICDRFIDSTRVYQGTLGNVDRAADRGRSSASPSATSSPISPSSSTCRPRSGWRAPSSGAATAPADRFEGEALEFHEQLRDAFRMLAVSEPERCVLIDATGTRDGGRRRRSGRSVTDRLDPATAPVALEGIAS